MKLLKHITWWGSAGLLILVLMVTDGHSFFKLGQSSIIAPGIITPTSLVVTLNQVNLEEAINGPFQPSLIESPISLDVVKKTGQADNILASGTAIPVEYHGIRFIFEGTGTYSGINPCTGLDATDETIILPDVVNNELVERFQVRHPVTGLKAGAREIDAFKVKSTPKSLNLVFPVSHAVGCISDDTIRAITGGRTGLFSPFSVFVDSVNGEIIASNTNAKVNSITVYNRNDEGDVVPQRAIQGENTGLDAPSGIYVDTTNDEIAVANAGNDTISIYPRTWDPSTIDLPPTRVIGGAATALSGPGGIYEYNDTLNGDEIYVTNGAANSITIYPRPSGAGTLDITPTRIIQGPTTGLSIPCGIYVDQNEIAVANRLDNSLNGDVYPLRTIKGDKTGIKTACGLFVDEMHKEVAIANPGSNSINFYDRDSGTLGSENIYPKRQIRGVNTGLSQPVGVFLDEANDEIAVANLGNDSITFHNRNDSAPYLLKHPQFIDPEVQQQLLLSYVYGGRILRGSGEPLPPTDPVTGQPYEKDPITDEPLTNIDATGNRLPIPLALGYAYVWKITDPTLHSAQDATNAFLNPPSDMQFRLADGRIVSNLQLGCAVFTPFIIDELTTNCQSQSLIISPFPAQPAAFRVAATLSGNVQNKTFVPNIAPLLKSDLPLVLPQFTLSPAGAILDVKWTYVNDSGQSLDGTPSVPKPLISRQSFQMTYSKPYGEISTCYQKRVNPNLAFSVGGLGPEVRSQSDIKDSGCDIFLKDVSNISFNVLDAYETRYVFSWSIVN